MTRKSRRDKHKVTSKEFIKKIADKTGYHMYEVSDILYGIYASIYEDIVEGNSIEFERLFIIEVKDSKQVPMNRQGEWIEYPKRKTLRLRVSRPLEDQLRRIAKANAENEKYTPSPYPINPNPSVE